MTAPPFAHGLASWTRLDGLSGAHVVVGTRDGERWLVRKVAATPEASGRLEGQAAKQARFAAAGLSTVRTPAVTAEGEIEGCFYFEMDYVAGVDAATFLRRASYPEVREMVSRLQGYLSDVARHEALVAGSPPSFFEALYDRLTGIARRFAGHDEAAMARLFVGLDRLRGGSGLEPTCCHGDLTLENLIVTAEGDLFAVDLLDAPFEHWWLDVAKLHQDLQGGWYLRNHPPIARGVLRYISDRLLRHAAAMDPAYEAVHPILVALNFARILPYADDAETLEHVLRRLRYFAELAEKGGRD